VFGPLFSVPIAFRVSARSGPNCGCGRSRTSIGITKPIGDRPANIDWGERAPRCISYFNQNDCSRSVLSASEAGNNPISSHCRVGTQVS